MKPDGPEPMGESGTMTTIIMRTTNDNRGQLFLALFQGFLSLGSLPVTLVFHEAPTGTRENID
jgi:hypothetical protein